MTVTFQPGFGAFGSYGGNIPSFMNPAGAGNDWVVSYIMAPLKAVRLRSLMIQALQPLAGGTPAGSVGVPYFVAVGPIVNNPQVQGNAPVPLALFANATFPFIPSLQTFQQQQYICWESGIASNNPWIPRTFSNREIIATANLQIVVAVASPCNITVAPVLFTNAPLWVSVLGEDDAIHEFALKTDPALGKWPVAG